MKNKNIILMIGMAIGLSGCVGTDDPIYQSLNQNFETVDVEDVTESYRVGWLAQGLLEPATRQEIANELVGNAEKIKSQFATQWETASDVGTAAQFVTDVAVGGFGSAAGSDVGAAVFVGTLTASLLMGDGSLDNASGIFLPNNWKNKPLDNTQEAEAAVKELIEIQILYAAKQLGYSAECSYSCEELPSLFSLKRQGTTDASEFIFTPNEFAIYVQKVKMLPAGETKGIDSLAAGFNVEWRTEYGHMAPLLLVANPVKAEGTDKIDISHEEDGSWNFHGDLRMSRTDFGDAFLRTYHSTPFTVYGTSDAYPKSVYYNGKRYRYVLNSQAETFDEIIIK